MIRKQYYHFIKTICILKERINCKNITRPDNLQNKIYVTFFLTLLLLAAALTVSPHGTIKGAFATYPLIIEPASDGRVNDINSNRVDGSTLILLSGTNYTATAVANVGFTFSSWLLDGNTVAENPITVRMNQTHQLEALFQESPE